MATSVSPMIFNHRQTCKVGDGSLDITESLSTVENICASGTPPAIDHLTPLYTHANLLGKAQISEVLLDEEALPLAILHEAIAGHIKAVKKRSLDLGEKEATLMKIRE